MSRKSRCNSVKAGSRGSCSADDSAEEEEARAKKRLYKDC